MPTYFQRPENALKRANEFIEVGKKEPALDVLYDVIKSKKHRTWQNKIHEPILFKYLELCVDLRRSHVAKEGLYQYKLICQQVNIASLEEVIQYFLKLANNRAEAAKTESRVGTADDEDVDDLDQIQTPESLLLSFVSGEDIQDRTDRVLLTPWVKFLWEAYRNVLELLRNNSRVEKLYHDTAQQAFKFCLDYSRRTEFRKLCDNLRNHLNVTLKHQGQVNSVNLNNVESIQLHLETRLAQLEAAISMELWQEAFKAVEDVHGMMQLSKRPPRPQVMANYYQKVALVFWKSGNYLFHAATQQRSYLLLREQKKTLTPEEIQKISSHVTLSILTIPIPVSLSDTEKYLELDEASREKSRRLAALLGLQTIPTRDSLIQEMIKANVPLHVMPQLQSLYQILEKDFHPLKLCFKVNEICEFLESCEDDMSQYAKPLQDIAIIRLLKQVAQVYQTIEFDRLLKLIPFADEHRLENAIVDIVKKNIVQVRIDHRTKSVKFGLDPHVAHREEVPEGPFLQSMPSESLRNQLTMMSLALNKSMVIITKEGNKEKKREEQQQLAQAYLRSARKEHKLMLERKTVIEARKEYLESLHVERERLEHERQRQQQAESLQAEQKRLEEERRNREVQRRRQELQDIEKKQAMDKIAALKKTTVGAKALKDLTPEEIDAMNPDDIIARQVEQLDKEKREQQIRLKTGEKKVDFWARAMRLEEIPFLKKQYEEKLVEDQEFWEKEEEKRINDAIEEHNKLVETSNRLRRMEENRKAFVESLMSSRNENYQAKHKAFEETLAQTRQQRLQERRLKRMHERKIQNKKDTEEAILREQEEKEQQEKEEKERKIREEKEAREREYQEKKAKLDEVARIQREREEEIERRERESREPQQDTDRRSNMDKGWNDDERDSGAWRRGGGRMDGDGGRMGDGGGRMGGDGGRMGDGGSWRGGADDRGRDAPPRRDDDVWRRPMDRGRDDFGRKDMDRRDDGEWRRDSRGPPRDGAGGGGGGWRDREGGDRGFGGGGGGWRDSGRDRGGFNRDRNVDRDSDSGRGGFNRDRNIDRDGDSGRGGFNRAGDGDSGRDRGFDRDSGRDRGFDRDSGPDRGFDRDSGRDRGFDRDSGRDRGFDRDSGRDRGGFDRGGRMDRGGGGGGGSWRSRESEPERGDGREQNAWRSRGDRPEDSSSSQPRPEGKSWSASRRGRDRPADGSEPDGWTTVQYK